MRSKFGTALALVAVLLTGTAAAAINTQALISPTGSKLGTASTTLLPADKAAAGVPALNPAAQISSIQSTSGGTTQIQASSAPSSQQNVGSTPAASSQVSAQPTASPSSSSVVYGNPNPTNGNGDDEDQDDDEGQDNDGDDD